MTIDRAENIRIAATALDDAMQNAAQNAAQSSPMLQIRQSFSAFSTARSRLQKQQPTSNAKLALANQVLTRKFADYHRQLGRQISALEQHLRRLRRARLVQLFGLFLAIIVSLAAFSLAVWYFWPHITAGLNMLLAPSPPATAITPPAAAPALVVP